MVESVAALVPGVASADASSTDLDGGDHLLLDGVARVGSWELDLGTGDLCLSTAMYHLFDLSSGEKPTFEALVDRVNGADRASARRAVRGTLHSYDAFEIELRLRVPAGDPRWIRARGRVALDRRGRPERLLGTVHDITQDKAAEDARAERSLHDSRSGLPNGTLLLARLTKAVQGLAHQPSIVGVIHLGIDQLTAINHSRGHVVGDQVVKAVADRLAGIIGDGDTLARLSGDEFAVLCEGLASEVEIVSIADQLRAALHEPLMLDGGPLVISVSAGVAAASASMGPEAILEQAEEALHGAKSAGGDRSGSFSDVRRAHESGRPASEAAPRRAIAQGDLRLRYQPIVDLVDGAVVGHEALVCWEDPTHGLGPERLLGRAELTGLLVPLGDWVLRQACREAKRFQDRDPRWAHLTMSVNLSDVALGPASLLQLAALALRDADLRPEDLHLELTETVFADDAAAPIAHLNELRDLGVRLGADDFGTGFSSLAHLRRFPFDFVKIDRAFVRGLASDALDFGVAATIVELAGALGLTVVAEGVENEGQRDCLVQLGCRLGQGHLYGRPMAAAEAESALDRAAAGGPWLVPSATAVVDVAAGR